MAAALALLAPAACDRNDLPQTVADQSITESTALPTPPSDDCDDLIVGGGFDGCGTNVGNAPAIPGWTITGQVDWWQDSGLTDCAVDLSGSPGAGALSQTIATVPGKEYQLRVDVKPNLDGAPAVKQLRLRAGSTTQKFAVTEKGTLTLTFVATKKKTTIKLSSDVKGAYGTFIDNVSVVPTGCDEVCTPGIPAEPPPTVQLFGTVRDFQFAHPDFEENKINSDKGIVLPALGDDDKPVYAGVEGNPTTSSQEAFDQWFRDVPGVNQSEPLAITLERVSDNPPLYRYSNNNFFPIDEQLLGNEGKDHNYAFTYEIATQFEYRGGETFKFRGDDDVFIYINRTLVLDLGGVHQAESDTVNLDAIAADVGLTVGQVYPLHIFFAERQTVKSEFEIETSIETLAECLVECNLGETRPCYSGAPGSIVPAGVCAEGVETCGPAGWSGVCEGEVLPGPAEVCSNAVDDDCNGVQDEGCVCLPSEVQACYEGPEGTLAVGVCAAGTATCDPSGTELGACTGQVLPTPEVCGNGLDDDCNTLTDETCACVPNQVLPCYEGAPETLGLGVCAAGTQTCDPTGSALSECIGQVLPAPAEICFNGVDDNCNGVQDEACVLEVPVNINGDCVNAACPPEAPFPVGCNLTFSGGDDRGCVSNIPGQSSVFIKEGNKCGAGNVQGILLCSTVQGPPLNEGTCPINKEDKFYPIDPEDCPD